LIEKKFDRKEVRTIGESTYFSSINIITYEDETVSKSLNLNNFHNVICLILFNIHLNLNTDEMVVEFLALSRVYFDKFIPECF
jgi:hypothetical protein